MINLEIYALHQELSLVHNFVDIAKLSFPSIEKEVIDYLES